MQKMFKRRLRWTVLAALSGFLAGISSTVFLYTLQWATDTRLANPSLMWGLPLAGLLIGWVYHVYGRDVAPGNNLILDEIHDPKKVVPFRMAPFILGGTVLTHLFGGSAGREGTAVQMGASLADQLTKLFKVEAEERKILLVCGAGAGFGAAIGAPWAGVIFGMEVLYVGRLKIFAWFESVVASLTGYYTAVLLGAPHSVFPHITVPEISWHALGAVAVSGVIFGVTAWAFSKFTHALEKLQARYIAYPPFKPLIGGALVMALYHLEGSFRFAGLGIPVIQQSILEPGAWSDPVYKLFFTALTVGSGFKGGEFVPLVFIGSTLGSALSSLLSVSPQLLASVGFAAVFGAAAKTPVACAIMAVEIFGLPIAPYAILGCFVSYWCSGRNGIYKAQR